MRLQRDGGFVEAHAPECCLEPIQLVHAISALATLVLGLATIPLFNTDYTGLGERFAVIPLYSSLPVVRGNWAQAVALAERLYDFHVTC